MTAQEPPGRSIARAGLGDCRGFFLARGRGDLGDAVMDGPGTVVPHAGELVIAVAMPAAVQELLAPAGGAHVGQLTAMMASQRNVSWSRWRGFRQLLRGGSTASGSGVVVRVPHHTRIGAGSLASPGS